MNSILHLNISDGRSQAQRRLPALQDGYFNVADRRFHSLLAMVVDYADVMRFVDSNNTENSTWKPYFTVDETVVIATILSLDPSKLTTRYKFHKTNIDNEWLSQALRADFSTVLNHQIVSAFTLANILDNWLVLLSPTQNKVGAELCRLVESVIVGLGTALQLLQQIIAQCLPNKSIKDMFSPIFVELVFSDNKTTEFKLADMNSIQSNCPVFIKAVEMVQVAAAQLLPATLSSKNHDPAIGLLIAFLQLFQLVNNKINRFTHNYINFYYDQVLKTQARHSVPDSVYLIVKLNGKHNKMQIPKGKEFLADLDDNPQNIIFTADEAVSINQATVCALQTLFFDRDELSSPENGLLESVSFPQRAGGTTRQLATGCWVNEIPILADADLVDDSLPLSHSLMGVLKNDEEPAQINHARIGFALASHALLLKEGQRTVTVTMQFDQTLSTNGCTLEGWIKDIADSLGVAEDSNSVSLATKQATFIKVFRHIFVISLSAQSGWLKIVDFSPSYSGTNSKLEINSLVITFSLSANETAIIPYSAEIHGEDYDTQLPVIKLEINPKGYLFPYGALSKLALASARLEVAVTDCRTLVLHNNIGQLSSQASFTPFGPIPERGAYLIVGNHEAATKKLVDFKVKIKWAGLPATMNGFKTYYHAYEKPLENADIKVSTSVLMDSKWFPETTKQRSNDSLFKSISGYDGSNRLSDSSILSCKKVLRHTDTQSTGNVSDEFSYDPLSKHGFFKFTLVEPLSAFGHQDYPNRLTKILTINAHQKKTHLLETVPNPPYTPVITAISVDYEAVSEIIVGKAQQGDSQKEDKLIHLHPSGWTSFNQDDTQPAYLLPQYPYSGNLFIGLKSIQKADVITLYFHLKENSLPIEEGETKELCWFYLSNNQWIALNERQVISDSTYGFMTSGIVTVKLPAEITQDNTLMPKGVFWLKVSADHNLKKFCSVYSVHAQAIKVTRWIDGNTALSHSPILPAGSISRLKQTMPGVSNISQMQPTFGGVPAENREQLHTRISGRLKHKNRALTPADYEILILEQFPQLWKVKCFANIAPDPDPEKQLSPGHLLIVALPYQTQKKNPDLVPLLSGHLINEIKKFVTKLAPPFVTIHAMNPVCETIQVRCTVKLKDGLQKGFYVNQLNQEISDFLTPWNETTGYTTHFGGTINEHVVESFIQQLDYIDRVTNFSLLRIAPEPMNSFDLLDSVAVSTDDNISPKYPWSIIAPIKHHFIEVDDSFEPIKAEMTGIGELEIGATFIITEQKWREKIERF